MEEKWVGSIFEHGFCCKYLISSVRGLVILENLISISKFNIYPFLSKIFKEMIKNIFPVRILKR